MSLKQLEFNFNYVKKDKTTKEVIIEGYANRAVKNGKKVVDRGKEHIPGSEWKIDEWKKNPILFFNHNRDRPIGKGVAVDVREDGLFIKAKISNSEVPEIKMVRDLIKERILRTFSVGIDPESEEDVDGVLHLKGVNLLEASVVTLPMNQESDFDISEKMLKEEHIDKIAADILREKGALLAATLHQRLYELSKAGQEFNRNDKLLEISSKAGVSTEELFEVMSGNTIGASEELIASFASELGIDLDTLNTAISEDKKIMEGDNNRPEEDAENEEEDNEDTNENETPTEEEDQEELTPENDEEALAEVGESEEDEGEEETALLEDSEELEPNEDHEDNEDLQEDDEDLEEEDKKKQNIQSDNFQKCVSKHVREALEAGKEQDEAIAFALNKCRDTKCNIDSQEWKGIFKTIEDFKKEKQAPTVELNTQTEMDLNPGNAMLMAQNQTNAMLGQLIGEIQKLIGVVVSTQKPMVIQTETQQISNLNADDGMIKTKEVDIINNYHEKLKARLDKT